MIDLPHNLEAEIALLGCLLSRPDCIVLTSDIVKPQHFSEALHSRIAETIAGLNERGSEISVIVVMDCLKDDKTLAEIGGERYLSNLLTDAPLFPEKMAPEYAQIIRDHADKRAVIDACEGLIETASTTEPGTDLRTTVAEHVTDLSHLIEGSTVRKSAHTIHEAANATLERVERMMAGEPDPTAIPTGIVALDNATGGLHRGEYVVLGARPSMGKTAIGVQLGFNVAKAGMGVAYFSLEMPAASISCRFLTCGIWIPEAPVAYQRVATGHLNEREMRWLQQERDALDGMPLLIEEQPGLTASEIEAKARVFASRFQRQGKSLDLIVVDHLHKMTAPNARSQVEAFTLISARLAEMAKRLDCPVLALAQLNRGVEARDDKRPTLADLRESGSIEQDADTVIFAYRDAYYLERQRCKSVEHEVDRIAEIERCQNSLELIIAKQRQGPIGTVELWADMAANVIKDPREILQTGEVAA